MKRLTEKPIIISLVSGKGGVSKTTSTVNLAAALSLQGDKILVVDVDRQSHSTKSFDLYDPSVPSVADVMVSKIDPRQVMKKTTVEGISVLPAAYEALEKAQDQINVDINRDRVKRLKILETLNEFDYILIDCPPDLGLLTMNALAVSDFVLVPVVGDRWGVEGLDTIIRKTDISREEFNERLTLLGIFLVRDNRTVLNRDIKESLREFNNDSFFKNTIRQSASIGKSSMWNTPIVAALPNDPVSQDYINLAVEMKVRIDSFNR